MSEDQVVPMSVGIPVPGRVDAIVGCHHRRAGRDGDMDSPFGYSANVMPL